MFRLISIGIYFFLTCTAFGQNNQPKHSKAFDEKFNQTKKLLSKNKTSEAIPVIRGMLKLEPENPNVHYLLGICFTQEEGMSDSAVHHLDKFSERATLDYNPASPNEKDLPVYVHYFLVVAHYQLGQCNKAASALEAFTNLYPKKDFYTKDASRRVRLCKEGKQKSNEPTRPTIPKTILVDSNFVASEVEYGTGFETYGIQIGAFSRFVPTQGFPDLNKNVKYHLTKKGTIRAIVGNFNRRTSAERLLKLIRKEGYEDAFIVRINEDMEGSKELISVDEIPLQRKIRGKIKFKVQVGAFEDNIPKELARNYLEIENLEEDHYDGMTYITSGSFKDFQQAKEHEKKLREKKGIQEAFIVAYDYDERVPLEKALHYLKKKEKTE